MWAATYREHQPDHSQRSPTHQESESGRIMRGRPPKLSEEDRGLVVAGLRHRVELAERILERHMGDRGAAERDHATPAGMDHGVDRGHAIPRGEHTIIGGRCSTALDVAERCRAGLDAHPRFDLRSDELTDAAEPRASERIEPRSEWASSIVSRWKPSATTTSGARPRSTTDCTQATIWSIEVFCSGMRIA